MINTLEFLLKNYLNIATTSFDQVTIYSEVNRDSDIVRENNVSKEIDIKKIKSDIGQKIKIHSNEIIRIRF